MLEACVLLQHITQNDPASCCNVTQHRNPTPYIQNTAHNSMPQCRLCNARSQIIRHTKHLYVFMQRNHHSRSTFTIALNTNGTKCMECSFSFSWKGNRLTTVYKECPLHATPAKKQRPAEKKKILHVYHGAGRDDPSQGAAARTGDKHYLRCCQVHGEQTGEGSG